VLNKNNKKLIVILGPTASGKTDLSIKLAKKFNGEIISADSRQVYKGLNIGSGKITKSQMQGIPHHLLDVANPKRKFTVAQFQKLALKKIKEIQRKDKTRAPFKKGARPSTKFSQNFSAPVPFLVGGTGFYIQSIVDGIKIPEVKPDWKLRKKLSRKNPSELYKLLLKLDPKRAMSIDKNNFRRLIRAIEIVLKTKKPIEKLQTKNQFDVLQIGIKKPPDELKKLIHKRLQKRLKAGMIAEVKKLNKSGISYKRLEELGLEYRFVAQYLQNKITYEEMVNKIQKESEHFAKRQMTWFKRDKRIHWIKNYRKIEKSVKNFVK